MRGSDLTILVIYKNRRLENSLQIHSVDQMKVSVKGVWICKKKKKCARIWLVTELHKIKTAQKISPLLLSTPYLVLPLQLDKEGHRATP